MSPVINKTVMPEKSNMRRRWTEDETVLALYLYFQLPFRKLHSGNPEIQQLASALSRPSNSVAMKLCNFASLDPKITESGRKGLSSESKLDRAVYAEFSQNWSGLVARAETLWISQVDPIFDNEAPSGLGIKAANSISSHIRVHRQHRP